MNTPCKAKLVLSAWRSFATLVTVRRLYVVWNMDETKKDRAEVRAAWRDISDAFVLARDGKIPWIHVGRYPIYFRIPGPRKPRPVEAKAAS